MQKKGKHLIFSTYNNIFPLFLSKALWIFILLWVLQIMSLILSEIYANY